MLIDVMYDFFLNYFIYTKNGEDRKNLEKRS
jgi:hypothetical protein